jgi:transaldolase
VLEELQAAGIDYDDLTSTLEREGVQKFADSFNELFDNVEGKRDALTIARS